MVDVKIKRVIVAAVSKNGIIGDRGNLPWHSKEELNHFKNLTIGFPIIFGRKTYESIDRTLPGRLNLIISSVPYKISENKDLLAFSNLFNAYNYLRQNKYEKVFLCGGQRIYRNAIKHSEEMIISHMKFNADGDKKFPRINRKKWKILSQLEFTEFEVIHYMRK